MKIIQKLFKRGRIEHEMSKMISLGECENGLLESYRSVWQVKSAKLWVIKDGEPFDRFVIIVN